MRSERDAHLDEWRAMSAQQRQQELGRREALMLVRTLTIVSSSQAPWVAKDNDSTCLRR